MKKARLAIHGAAPLRSRPLPGRCLCDARVLKAVTAVFEHSWASGKDFGYQGVFEEKYTQCFCQLQGGGFADAVSSGTAALYLALQALDLPRGSEVLCSPLTDPGSIGAVLALGLCPAVADSAAKSFNVDSASLEKALSPQTKALLLTHTGGIAVDMEAVARLVADRTIPIVEDCSQAHLAAVNGVPVGNFGQVAAFSTMFSKNHSTGGCGGLVFTRDETLYWKIRALADRGKPFDRPNFNEKNPVEFLFPAMNFQQNELACAIGLETLSRLPQVNARRREIVACIAKTLQTSQTLQALLPRKTDLMAPFFLTILVNTAGLTCTAADFALAVQAEGFSINPHYNYVLAGWPWLHPYCKKNIHTPQALATRDSSFNILFHEKWADSDVQELLAALLKVEAYFCI